MKCQCKSLFTDTMVDNKKEEKTKTTLTDKHLHAKIV